MNKNYASSSLFSSFVDEQLNHTIKNSGSMTISDLSGSTQYVRSRK